MNAPLRIHDSTAGATRPPGDGVKSWLDVLTPLLEMPEREAAGVRDELESHLQDRVRDLLAMGVPEPEASRQAIAELGDAAALAQRFQRAIVSSRRRTLMHVSVIGAAGAALAISIGAAVLPARQPADDSRRAIQQDVAALQAMLETYRAEIAALRDREASQARMLADLNAEAGRRATALQDQDRALEDLMRRVRAQPAQVAAQPYQPPENDADATLRNAAVHVTTGETWAQFIEAAGKAADRTPVVHWDKLQEAGIAKDAPLGLPEGPSTVADVLMGARPQPDRGGNGPAARVEDRALVFASDAYFDARESELVVYDLTALVRQRRMLDAESPPKLAEVVEQASHMLTELVLPDMWRENGGDRASITAFGTKLFVQAPRRVHPHVKWVLEQLAADGGEAGAGALLEVVPEVRRMSGAGASDRRVPILGDLPILSTMFRPGARADANASPSGSFVLQRTNVDAMRDLVGDILNIVPALKECGVPRSVSMDPVTNRLVVVATPGQVEAIGRIVAALDAEGPLTDVNVSDTRTYVLKHVPAQSMREILSRWFNINKAYKECGVDRVIEVNDATLTLTCTPGQAAAAQRLIEALDADD